MDLMKHIPNFYRFRKMRLDGGTEANMETANGTVSSDSNDCKTTHPDDQTITNGEVNDTEMNNEADKNSSSKENDKTPLETFEECWKQGDESSATAEAAQPEETQIGKQEPIKEVWEGGGSERLHVMALDGAYTDC